LNHYLGTWLQDIWSHISLKHFDGLLPHDLPARFCSRLVAGRSLDTHESSILIDANSDHTRGERGKQFLKQSLIDKIRHAVKMRKYNQLWQQTKRFDPCRLSAG